MINADGYCRVFDSSSWFLSFYWVRGWKKVDRKDNGPSLDPNLKNVVIILRVVPPPYNSNW